MATPALYQARDKGVPYAHVCIRRSFGLVPDTHPDPSRPTTCLLDSLLHTYMYIHTYMDMYLRRHPCWRLACRHLRAWVSTPPPTPAAELRQKLNVILPRPRQPEPARVTSTRAPVPLPGSPDTPALGPAAPSCPTHGLLTLAAGREPYPVLLSAQK